MSFKKTVTKKQLAANRANAQKSSGPSSSIGKAVSSQNRVTHGLTGRFNVLKPEIQQVFDEMLAHYVRIEQPADEMEYDMIFKMACHAWMSQRAMSLQESCFSFTPQNEEQIKSGHAPVSIRSKDLEHHMRYQTHHDRAYARVAAQLASHKKQRQLGESGFVRQKQAVAEEERKQERQIQRTERHHIAVALDKKRLEIAECKAMKEAHDLAPLFEEYFGAQTAQKAA